MVIIVVITEGDMVAFVWFVDVDESGLSGGNCRRKMLNMLFSTGIPSRMPITLGAIIKNPRK